MFRMRNRVPLDQLFAHPQNPRKSLTVDELAVSIQESGLLTPILVRRLGKGFQIISGHRRKAALESIGEKYADCDIIEMNDEQAYKALMTANIQAKSLSEVEEAEGIKHMIDTYEWTQERVSKELGKSKAWVSYRVSILESSNELQEKVHARELTLTHAREIAQLPQDRQESVARKVVEDKLSTRETAELVKRINSIPNQTEPEPPQQVETAFENHTELRKEENFEPKPEERRLYSDPDMKRISEMNGFILKMENMELDLFAHESVLDALVEFGRGGQALRVLDKIESRIGWVRKHITNAMNRPAAGTGEGLVLEFRRKEA